MASLMSTDEALRFIAASARSGVVISTIDGFHVVPKGYMENVDLMFTPDDDCTPAEAAAAGQKFIRENDRPGIVWEVLAEIESSSRC
jgi:hypothetical protein